MGAPFRQPEWSALALIEAPDAVTRVHEAFVQAGAEVISTNSYAVVPFHLGEAVFAERGHALASLAGRLAREVANRAPHPVQVAGALPPIGGSYRADQFNAETARPVLQTLVDALAPYVDHWQAETLSAIEEAELVRDVLGEDVRPLWLSFTLYDEDSLGPPRLRSGQQVDDAVRAAIRLKATAVLFNCSQPEVMAEAVTVARTVIDKAGSDLHVGVYANAFPPQRSDAEANAGLDDIRSDLTEEGYTRFARAWQRAGATLIGGCCGIGPEHIGALHRAFKQ
ncbi:hypothetical protein ABENE_11110 [Asticcacaulis benevestitus DSM 16100 = ATCC BAA-896]|uniref:Hcy-binding domain-containing protein n=2 Tax=Asticcacaulis TaxID=76890 RepID=V4PAQ5_9CAUL|nr:hypothetical protein ABENE_11110 [Asticcacaulis benevestitus DSM 16100 = ATCC BAA-896]